jgi:flagella basal body P-ring formation protein FlgA
MSFALGLAFVATQFGQAAGFADLDAIDRQVAAFTGVSVGAPGGAAMPVDRRMRLRTCAAPLAVSWNGMRRDSIAVQCPEAGGWRIYVQVAGAGFAAAAAAQPAVTRGDSVTIAVTGDGFSVSQPGEALEGGPIGAWIRVRAVSAAPASAAAGRDTMRAQIVRPGMVAIPLP